MAIEFDPAKPAENLRKHGVAFPDVEAAFYDDYAQTIEDPDAVGEQRFLTLAMDSLNRVLVICFTERDDNIRIISARKASNAEARTYDEKRLRLQQR
ncbi:BrnT family toxin [beta proteobacterium MWH-UniP1]